MNLRPATSSRSANPQPPAKPSNEGSGATPPMTTASLSNRPARPLPRRGDDRAFTGAAPDVRQVLGNERERYAAAQPELRVWRLRCRQPPTSSRLCSPRLRFLPLPEPIRRAILAQNRRGNLTNVGLIAFPHLGNRLPGDRVCVEPRGLGGSERTAHCRSREWTLITMLSTYLEKCGLRFRDSTEERKFFEETFLARRTLMQIWLVIGGIVFYYFFVWDQIIDLNSSRYTQAIRGLLGVPISWGCSALLFVRSLQNWYEWIALAPVVIAIALLAIIYSILHDGFDYGAAAGPVLVILFGICAFQVRTIPFVVVVLVSWIIFSSLQLFAGNAKSGMFLVNNMGSSLNHVGKASSSLPAIR